jgi:all-trans-retinol 13,14-reductase
MIWKQTLALFPQLKDKVEYMQFGSPITNKYYIGANKGEMYGCDHNLARFTPLASTELRPETNIKNLYLAGQDIFTCGFVGGAFGGLICASSILNRNVYNDLTVLKKKSK